MTQTLLAEDASAATGEPQAAPRRRVLLAVHSAKLGGAERMALLEAESLASELDLLISVPDGPLSSRFARHGERVPAIATLPLWGASPTRWLRSGVRTLLDAFAMSRLIRRRGIELVITNSSVCLAAVLAARLARVPAIVHARDVPRSRLAPPAMALQGLLAQTVIVIAEGLEPYFRRGRRARIVRIPDGVRMPATGGLQARVERNSPPRLCLVGGIDPRKGQDTAIEALAELQRLGVAATLDLVGRELDASYAAKLREMALRLAVSERVAFVGEVQDAGPWLERADVVIAPSRGEWTPLVLMEALSRTKPVVAARVGGVAEVLSGGECGLLVAPEDPAALAGAVARLLEDPAAATAMAERGRERVSARFSVQRTLAGLRGETDRLLGRVQSAREHGRPRIVL